MKKKILILATTTTLILSATACGMNAAPKEERQAGAFAEEIQLNDIEVTTNTDAEGNTEEISLESSEDVKTENKQKLEFVLDEISNVKPGSAGASERNIEAAANLIFVADELYDNLDRNDIVETVKAWRNNADEINKAAFDEAYENVLSTAKDYLVNPNLYNERFENMGITFILDDNTKLKIENVCDYVKTAIQ